MADLGGRPPILESPEQAEAKISEYFEWVKGEYDKDNGEWIRLPEPVTITGLALYLGFSSRQGLYDYEDKQGFSCIRKARLKVEYAYERSLTEAKNPTGSIFALKNMGWSDKQEINQATTIKDERIDESKLTDEELRTLVALQRKSGTS